MMELCVVLMGHDIWSKHLKQKRLTLSTHRDASLLPLVRVILLVFCSHIPPR